MRVETYTLTISDLVEIVEQYKAKYSTKSNGDSLVDMHRAIGVITTIEDDDSVAQSVVFNHNFYFNK